MTSNIEDLQKALLQGVVDCDLGMPIAQENAAFDKPADGTPWAAVFVLPNVPSVATLGDGGQDAHDGILQIDLNHKLNSGTAASIALQKKLAEFFKAGRVLTYNDTSVHIAACGGGRSRPAEGYYRTSLTVSWFARITR